MYVGNLAPLSKDMTNYLMVAAKVVGPEVRSVVVVVVAHRYQGLVQDAPLRLVLAEA